MKRKNAWEKYNENERKEIFRFCEDYRKFISECKTERECVEALTAKRAKIKEVQSHVRREAAGRRQGLCGQHEENAGPVPHRNRGV